MPVLDSKEPDPDEFARLRRLRDVGKIASSLVHDLNNTLSAVVAYVDMQAEQSEREPDRKFMTQVRSSLSRGVNLLGAVSRYALERSGGRESVSLDALVDDCTPLLAAAARRAQLALDVEAAGAPSVRVRQQDAKEVILRAVMFAASTCKTARQVRIELNELAELDRVWGGVLIEVAEPSGDVDRGLRAFLDGSDGDAAADGMTVDAGFLASILTLHLNGGRFELPVADTRRMRIMFPGG